jgi:hypothetical protein
MSNTETACTMINFEHKMKADSKEIMNKTGHALELRYDDKMTTKGSKAKK